MNGIVIDAPAPYCVVREDHFKRGYVKAEFTDIRQTWERHAPGWHLQRPERQLEQHGAEKP